MAKLVKQYNSSTRRHSSRRNRHEVTIGNRMSAFLLSLCALALVMAYISIFINPHIFWLPMFFGIYYLPLVFLNIVLLAVMIFRRSSLLMIPLIALIPSLLFSDQYLKFGEEQIYHSGDSIKVMTYNLGRFSACSAKIKKSDVRILIADKIESVDPDIVCLQEFAVADTSELANFMPQYRYRYSHLFKGTSSYFGNVTLSRYPIIDSETILFLSSCNLSLVTDIEVGARVLKVFNCHLESYGISFTSMVKKLSDKNFFADEIMQLHEHFRSASIKRAEQVDCIALRCDESPYPTFVCGDFNETPVSYVYHTLSKNKRDGFVESGSGFSSTYSALWPLLRIDYIMVPQEYSTEDYTVERIPFSDHYPVTTSIYF